MNPITVDERQRTILASLVVALAAMAVGCSGVEGVASVGLIALKVFAGVVFAILVFFPLMASIAAIRAAIRRFTGKSNRN